MGTLTIEGHKIPVDDSFANLSEAQQHAVVDAKVAELKASGAWNGNKPNSDPGIVDNVSRAIVSGIPFSDRYMAGVQTLHDWLKGPTLSDQITGEKHTYDENLAKVRAKNQQLEENHPYLSMAGNFAGGLLVPAGAIGAAGKGASLGMKAARAAMGGAGAGAVQGVSDTQDLTNVRDLGKNVLTSGAAGAAIGGSIPLLSNAIGAGARAILNARNGNAAGMSKEASKHLIDALRADGVSNVQRRAGELGPNGMLVDTGAALEGKGAGAYLNSDEAQSVMNRRLEGRNEGRNVRIQDDVNSNFGPTENPRQVIEDLTARRTAQDSVRFPAALNAAPPVNTGNARAAALGLGSEAPDLSMQQRAMNRAHRMLQREDHYGNLVPDTDARRLHNAKVEMDRVIDYDLPGMDLPAGAASQTNGSLVAVRRQLREDLGNQVPGYNEANQHSAHFARQIDAVNNGQQFLNSGREALRPDELERMFAAMSPEERLAFQKGARGEIDRLFATKSNDLSAGKNIIKDETDWNIPRLRTVFGDEEANNVASAIDREANFARTYNNIVGNSQTARRTAAKTSMKPEPSSETPIINPNMSVTGLLATGGKKLLGKMAKGFETDPTAAYGEIGRILTDTGANRDRHLQSLVDALNNRIANSGRGDLAGSRSAALAAALASGSVREHQSKNRAKSKTQ